MKRFNMKKNILLSVICLVFLSGASVHAEGGPIKRFFSKFKKHKAEKNVEEEYEESREALASPSVEGVEYKIVKITYDKITGDANIVVVKMKADKGQDTIFQDVALWPLYDDDIEFANVPKSVRAQLLEEWVRAITRDDKDYRRAFFKDLERRVSRKQATPAEGYIFGLYLSDKFSDESYLSDKERAALEVAERLALGGSASMAADVGSAFEDITDDVRVDPKAESLPFEQGQELELGPGKTLKIVPLNTDIPL
ncbi:hypothetical protein GW915_02995 [bacterium]|nr:hypothetical protein [bacterium]